MGSEEISPEELLSLVKESFDVPDDQLINMLPLYELVSRVAEWDGPVGQEPMWLVEADEFLRTKFYSARDLEEYDITQEEYFKMSIPQRAAIHNLFGILGNYQKKLRSESQEESTERLLPDVAWPKYEPTPASIIETDYASDRSYLLRAGCSKCKGKSDLLPSREAFAWVESHNLGCR